jgi:hypothetical protein
MFNFIDIRTLSMHVFLYCICACFYERMDNASMFLKYL